LNTLGTGNDLSTFQRADLIWVAGRNTRLP